MRLSFCSVDHGPAKDGLQLLGVWWGDGVPPYGQLHQGQAHAPDVRLHRVVGALQPLRLSGEKGKARGGWGALGPGVPQGRADT